MAITNSIELHSSLLSFNQLMLADSIHQHEKKSCCLASLPQDYLLQLNGLSIQVRSTFPYDHVFAGRVLAVLIYSDQTALSSILFLQDGVTEPDFLHLSDSFLVGIVKR